MSENERKPSIRFAGFDDAWEQRKLCELGEVITGNTPPTANQEYYSGDFSFVSPADIQGNRFIDKTITTLTKKGFEQGRKICNGSSLFVSIGSTIGKVAQANRDLITNQQINSMVPYLHNDKDFVFTLLEAISPQIRKLSATQAVPIVNKTTFSEHRIFVPIINEQEQIGNFFWHLDNLITLHQRKYDKLVSVKKSMLEKMFPKNGSNKPEIRFSGFTDPWEQRKLIDIVYRITEMSNKMGLPRVEYEDINSGLGTLNKDLSGKHCNKQGVLFQADDVLFGKLRPYLKNWLMADFSGIAVGDFWVLRSFDTDSSFIYTLIQSDVFDKVANRSTGTKMPRADWSLVSNTYFEIPHSKTEQHQIGTFFHQLDNLITLHQRKLEKLKNIKKSMLEKMFV